MAELDGERAADMVIEKRSDPGGAPVVAVSGELDISNAATLEATVAGVEGIRS